MYATTVDRIKIVLILLVIFLLSGSNKHALASLDASNIIIDNIVTEPSVIHRGDYFTLNATVKNISNDTIDILDVGCKGPIHVTFDKNVEVKSVASGICFNQQPILTLKPAESLVLSAPDFAQDYKASLEGNVEATIQLEYIVRIDNETAPTIINGTESNYTWIFSQPFNFTILPPLVPNYNKSSVN
jgi:hypothetical protein